MPPTLELWQSFTTLRAADFSSMDEFIYYFDWHLDQFAMVGYNMADTCFVIKLVFAVDRFFPMLADGWLRRLSRQQVMPVAVAFEDLRRASRPKDPLEA